MSQTPMSPSTPGMPRHAGPRPPGLGLASLLILRKSIPRWQALLFAALCIALCFGIWWFVTRGEPEERIVAYNTLPSPRETFSAFPDLWTTRHLAANVWASLRRVTLGFGLAAAVGIPLGILCGCFTPLNAFFTPISIFGRNIPIAALIPLT